jgi:hypothetical protein
VKRRGPREMILLDLERLWRAQRSLTFSAVMVEELEVGSRKSGLAQRRRDAEERRGAADWRGWTRIRKGEGA